MRNRTPLVSIAEGSLSMQVRSGREIKASGSKGAEELAVSFSPRPQFSVPCGTTELLKHIRHALAQAEIDSRHILAEQKNNVNAAFCGLGLPLIQQRDPRDIRPVPSTQTPRQADLRSGFHGREGRYACF